MSEARIISRCAHGCGIDKFTIEEYKEEYRGIKKRVSYGLCPNCLIQHHLDEIGRLDKNSPTFKIERAKRKNEINKILRDDAGMHMIDLCKKAA